MTLASSRAESTAAAFFGSTTTSALPSSAFSALTSPATQRVPAAVLWCSTAMDSESIRTALPIVA
ncbi:hypothetical protein ACFPRL_30345 [Pseudoclavibacter helvolus]